MDNIHPIELPSWETGLHSDGLLYPEPQNPEPEVNVIDS